MNNSKKGLGVILVLIIVLFGVLTLGFLRDKKFQGESEGTMSEAVESQEESTDNEDTSNEEQPLEEPVEEPSVEYKDLSSKLKNKVDVRMLVLGDGLALSQGRASDAGIWDRSIANWITSKYGSKVELISLAKGGSTSAMGYEVATNNDISKYDLILVCFGQNDNNKSTNVDTFNTNYQGIINKVKEGNPDGTILLILPSTLTGDNSYRVAMKSIAETNNFNAVDINEEFKNSGIATSELVSNGLPNDKGYELYTQAVTKVIEGLVE